MTRILKAKPKVRRDPAPVDLRTPNGRILPY
jgi:hypothetical protein